jgi:hypothetical protein
MFSLPCSISFETSLKWNLPFKGLNFNFFGLLFRNGSWKCVREEYALDHSLVLILVFSLLILLSLIFWKSDLKRDPAWSAEGCAFIRHLLSLETDPKFRGHDNLSQIFLGWTNWMLSKLYVYESLRYSYYRISQKIFPGLVEHLIIRSKLGDRLFEEALSKDNFTQIVILGSGKKIFYFFFEFKEIPNILFF